MLKTLLLKDSEGSALIQKEKKLYFLLLFFFFSLYTPVITWVYNVAMWMFVAYCFFFNSIKEKCILLKQRRLLWFIIVFFLLSCISAAMSNNKGEAISWIGYRPILLVIPVSLGTLYINPVLKDRIIAAFAFATTSGAIFCLVWGAGQANSHHDISLLYNDNLSAIINYQSVYLATLINLAIFSYIYLLLQNDKLLNKNLLIPILLVLFTVNFLLASRIAIMILYSSIFIFGAFYILKRKKYLEGVTLIMGLLLGCFLLVKFFPKTLNRFKELTYTKFHYGSEAKESHFNMELNADQWNGANIRLAVWQCAWTVIEQNKFTGTGLGDKLDELKVEYAKKGFLFGVKTNRNVHNNYLDIWMSMGIAGILVFLAGFIILPLVTCLQRKDFYGLVVLISLALCLITETYTDRMIGNTVLAFFISFITAYKIKAR